MAVKCKTRSKDASPNPTMLATAVAGAYNSSALRRTNPCLQGAIAASRSPLLRTGACRAGAKRDRGLRHRPRKLASLQGKRIAASAHLAAENDIDGTPVLLPQTR